MEVSTTRFGRLHAEADDLVLFPAGLLGMQHLRHWLLLSDACNAAVAWLQSAESDELAFAVVSPRRFAPHFQLRIGRRELQSLGLESLSDAEVLAIVGQSELGLTLNLKAPLVIDLERRLGRQVVNRADLPVQFSIRALSEGLRTVA